MGSWTGSAGLGEGGGAGVSSRTEVCSFPWTTEPQHSTVGMPHWLACYLPLVEYTPGGQVIETQPAGLSGEPASPKFPVLVFRSMRWKHHQRLFKIDECCFCLSVTLSWTKLHSSESVRTWSDPIFGWTRFVKVSSNQVYPHTTMISHHQSYSKTYPSR